MFCGVPSSDLSRNMDIAHRGVLMNLRCEAVFTAEIGQYSGIELLSRRSQIMRLCYLTPSLFKYLHKTPYYREMLDRNIKSEISLMSLPGNWVSDCAIRETSDQRGKWLKTFFTFDFHILLLQRHTDARIIPCRCISVKKDFQWGPCWEPTLPATETVSANWIVVERFKMSQRSHRYIFLQTRTHIMTINQHNSVRHAFSVPNCAASSTCWQFFQYRPPGELRYTTGPIAKILCKNSIYIATHTHIYYIYR